MQGWEQVDIIGYNPDVDTTTLPEVVSSVGGEPLVPAVLSTLSMVSTDASDKAGESGCQSVTVVGLNGSYNETQETFVTNGLVPVVGLINFLRINTAFCASAGSSKKNLGTITFTHGASIIGSMSPSKSVLTQALYTVPNGKILLVESIDGSIEGATSATGQGDGASIEIQKESNGVWKTIDMISVSNSGASTSAKIYNNGRFTVIRAQESIRAIVTSVATNDTGVYSTLKGYLIDESLQSL